MKVAAISTVTMQQRTTKARKFSTNLFAIREVGVERVIVIAFLLTVL